MRERSSEGNSPTAMNIFSYMGRSLLLNNRAKRARCERAPQRTTDYSSAPGHASVPFALRCISLAVFAGVAAFAQTLAPGQLPPGPPPAPGQLGPRPEKLPPNQPTPDPKEERIEDAASPTFRSNVHYLLVPTTVFDPDGHGYVNGLTVSDFQVLDNGKPQRITSDFSMQPVSVVLVVQANSEVQPLLPAIQKAGVLLQGLVSGQEGDAAILAFDHRMQVEQDFTSDPAKLDDAMHKITAGSSTAAINDAVMQADQMLRQHDRQNTRRRVIILMTRNVDKGSQIKLPEAIHRMQFDNIIVYCVDMSRFKTALLNKPGYPRPANGGIPPEAIGTPTGRTLSETDVLTQADGNWLNTVPPLARGIRDLFKRSPAEAYTYFTGGKMYSFSNLRGLETAITDIGKDLNSQYLLTYALPQNPEPGFHTIRVIVDRPEVKVLTRPGYWAGAAQ